MKDTLDHLNLQKQKEVAYIRKVILEELSARLRASKSERTANYRILKLVLYGSFARGTWFDDRNSGRASDYDFLVIVSHKALTDMSSFWAGVEDRIYRDPKIQKDVSLIVHTLREVNAALREGQYFFSEILNQGVLLYDSDDDPKLSKAGYKRSIIARPGKLTLSVHTSLHPNTKHIGSDQHRNSLQLEGKVLIVDLTGHGYPPSNSTRPQKPSTEWSS